jgi:hypothetical protein
MKISYGFVFYLEVVIIALTALQTVLYLKPIRNLIFTILNRYQFGEGRIIRMLWWIIFLVITIILLDSVLSYWSIRETLKPCIRITT